VSLSKGLRRFLCCLRAPWFLRGADDVGVAADDGPERRVLGSKLGDAEAVCDGVPEKLDDDEVSDLTPELDGADVIVVQRWWFLSDQPKRWLSIRDAKCERDWRLSGEGLTSRHGGFVTCPVV
jgi:hypothetical protein